MSYYFLLLAGSALLALANFLLGHFGIGNRSMPLTEEQRSAQYLTFNKVVSYLAGFGFMGWILEGMDVGLEATLASSAIVGGVAAWLSSQFSLAELFGPRQEHGRMADALGHEARVTQAIGPQRTGRGKILAPLRNGLQEGPAVTNAPEGIPAQAMVVVTGVDRGVFIVMPRQ